MNRTRWIALSLGVLLLALLVAPGVARAEEPAPETVAPAEKPAEPPPLTQEELGRWLTESTPAVWAGGIARFLPMVIGIGLLILLWTRRRNRGEALAPVVPVATPTVPFSPSGALILLAFAWLVAPTLVTSLTDPDSETGRSIVFRMLVAQASLLPVAIIVVVQRLRMGASANLKPPVVPLGVALWTVCVAAAVVVPLALVSAIALHLLDLPMEVYGPIRELMEGAGTLRPWLIAFFAVVLAPIGEEAAFRGLLYPALRGVDTPRWRRWAAALCVAFLFALVHWHAGTFLPLFALALVLTWVFETTNSLGTVMIAHGIWNFLTLLPLLLRASA